MIIILLLPCKYDWSQTGPFNNSRPLPHPDTPLPTPTTLSLFLSVLRESDSVIELQICAILFWPGFYASIRKAEGLESARGAAPSVGSLCLALMIVSLRRGKRWQPFVMTGSGGGRVAVSVSFVLPTGVRRISHAVTRSCRYSRATRMRIEVKRPQRARSGTLTAWLTFSAHGVETRRGGPGWRHGVETRGGSTGWRHGETWGGGTGWRHGWRHGVEAWGGGPGWRPLVETRGGGPGWRPGDPDSIAAWPGSVLCRLPVRRINWTSGRARIRPLGSWKYKTSK